MVVFVDIDWGCRAHAVSVIDAKGIVLDRFDVGHDRAGLAALVTRLKKHGMPSAIPIALERPSGLLVDGLVEAGFVVTPIHPNVVKACRLRYRAVAAKSDPGDVFILADILRTDGHHLRPLAPQSDAIKAMRGLVRGRDNPVGARVARARQLSVLLASFWPGTAVIFSDLASPIAPAFLERYPMPEAAARLGPKRLAGFLAQHRYCGRRSPEALLERLRSAPVRARFPNEHQLAAEAGVVPVTRQSGNFRGAGWRWACNERLRAALTCLADNSPHQSPWAADVYRRARARGCDHPHAIRMLARAWARVLWRAWTDRAPYDPGGHRGAQALVA